MTFATGYKWSELEYTNNIFNKLLTMVVAIVKQFKKRHRACLCESKKDAASIIYKNDIYRSLNIK